ncbi:MAG: hypothetical protein JNG85_09215 [Spirochaetaceae bacterium]|nr:hypothetical protein [Spirochaetaceae bacterium]
MNAMRDLESRFDRAAGALLGALKAGEELSLEFAGESSLFMRFNQARVRQIGAVEDAMVDFKFCRDGRTSRRILTLTGEAGRDAELAARALEAARAEAALLPVDPYQVLPAAGGSSSETFPGKLPDPDAAPKEVLGPAAGMDFVGIHAQGAVARGAANSKGARHWFAAENFSTDWSAWLPSGKAVKSCYAGREWDSGEHARRLQAARPLLEGVAKPDKVLEPGSYRAYVSPGALEELMVFFSWRGLSEREFREGESSFMALREGRKSLSPKFALTQDFTLGVEPRFNELGEVAPERLVLIDGGRLASSLVSARTALQYGVASNAAPEHEGLRSPAVAPGGLAEADALKALGTGLYVSNFHYANWSDFENARVTGMTRFACFWVEGGKIVSPIKDMRFDESLYDLFGANLEDLTRERSLIPAVGSYGMRDIGGMLLPGLLVNGLRFTL